MNSGPAMTILNVAIDRDRALIATNTEGVRLVDGRPTIVSKLLPLPAVNAVLAARGQIALLINVYADCFAAMANVDRIIEILPASIADCYARLMMELAASSLCFDLDSELVLVGWSDRAQRVIGIYYKISAAGALERFDFSESGMISPAQPDWGKLLPLSLRPDDMAKLVKRQSDCAQGPQNAVNGDILFAEVTRQSVTTTVRSMPLA